MKHEFAEGISILRALQSIGIKLPALCDDPRLKPIGACRLCLVTVAGVPRPLAACHTQLAAGMDIQSYTPELAKIRRTNLHLLATRHTQKEDQPSAVELHQCLGGNLKHLSFGPALQELGDDSHPYIRVDMTRCIDCFRCVRICNELQGQFAWRVWNRGDAIRIMPDSGTTLLESSCVSCGACADTCPTGAIEDKSIFALGAPTQWTRTTCPYCGVGCEMLVGTRRGRIVQIKPAMDSAVNKGHLCVKGRYAFDFVHAPDRVTDPMIRRNGIWKPATWLEAIAFVAENFKNIAAKHGPDSIGVLGSARGTNEENYLAQKFARVVLGTNNIDCCARVCHAPTAAGMKQTLGTGAATNSFEDIERAATFLVCGCNPTENHPIIGARIKQAVLRGAKLIVIDPREIELARYADLHLQLRPGTNVPLLNAMACVILEEGLIDEKSVRDRVNDFDAFRDFIGTSPPDRAAHITGVPAEDIRFAARLYAQQKPAMCFHGLGVTEHVQGTEGVISLVNLALITGNFGKPGSGINPLRGQNNVQGAAHMGCEPDNLTGYVPLDQGRDVFESVWRVPLPRTRGLNLMEMMDAAAEQRLKALWAIGYDVAFTNPNARATKAALARLDFVVVQDLFLTDSARELAHVFLPACSSFEKDGTFMNSERRVQRLRRALEPIGNSKADWEIISAIAGAMGFVDQFKFRSPEEIWNEVRAVWNAGAGISYARLEKGGLQWPCPRENHPGTSILHTESFPHGPRAPLSRITFQPTDETSNHEFPFLLTTGRALYQFNSGTMTMRTPNVRLRETDALEMAPTDAVRLGFSDGDHVRVRSRHGEALMPVKTDPGVKPGELFATFHSSEVFLNNLTGPQRDRVVMTPEYKVVAVNLERG